MYVYIVFFANPRQVAGSRTWHTQQWLAGVEESGNKSGICAGFDVTKGWHPSWRRNVGFCPIIASWVGVIIGWADRPNRGKWRPSMTPLYHKMDRVLDEFAVGEALNPESKNWVIAKMFLHKWTNVPRGYSKSSYFANPSWPHNFLGAPGQSHWT